MFRKKVKEEMKVDEDNTPDLEVDLPKPYEDSNEVEPIEEEDIEEEPIKETEIEEVEEDLKDIDSKIKKLQEKKEKKEKEKEEDKPKLQIVGASLIEGGLYQYTCVSNKLLPIGGIILL